MSTKLQVYNTLSRSKVDFVPLNPPFTGMYVCGPTVYGDPHLGHARPGITFDLVYRYLKHLGYKVRYVRNITDVGHLENDADEGEDKIAKKARVEQLEPMEVAQYYTDRYHEFMSRLNVLQPGIEPRASGHIIEQISMVEKILANGFAYEVDGSVYFDVPKYSKSFNYGKLSGRILDDLLTNTRNLDGQEEKRHPADFALWKKAQAGHIMRWASPWGEGFPGWHLECSAMGGKYLGQQFDIHGGGMDLLFPHHESEIAQSQAANGVEPVRYWLHNNMITINGQKMGKSLNNFITLEEFFTGKHEALKQAYSPMTIRFFILQAHYRGTLDFSNEALQAAEKALKKLSDAISSLDKLSVGALDSEPVADFVARFSGACTDAMNDDFSSPMVIAQLFEATRIINLIKDGKETATTASLENIRNTFHTFFNDILGLRNEQDDDSGKEMINGLMDLIINIRNESRFKKDFATSDLIRDHLAKAGIVIKDGKNGTEWTIG